MISSKDRDELAHTLTLLAAVITQSSDPLVRSALHQCVRTLNVIAKKLAKPVEIPPVE